MADVMMHWVPEASIEPDTIAWGTLQGVLTPTERLEDSVSSGQAAAKLAEHGYTLFVIKECEAFALALLGGMDYHLCALTRWHGSLNNEVIVAKPGMPSEARRHSLVSNVLWEKIERTEFSEAAGLGADEYNIKVYFKNHGFSQYEGRELMVGASDQILGTTGFSVRIPELSYAEDVAISRKVFQLCLVAPNDTKAADIVKAVEDVMDHHKVPISYKVPRFTVVKPVEPVTDSAEGEGEE